MNPDSTSQLRRGLAFPRARAGCLLLLYLVIATPVAPLLTGLLAMTDRSHHVLVEPTLDGTHIVLHHECRNSPTHQHGLVARALTVIAQQPSFDGDPDHVISFSGGVIAQQSPPACPTPAAVSACAVPPLPTCTCEVACALFPANGHEHPRPPPALGGSLLNVRSTVFLI